MDTHLLPLFNKVRDVINKVSLQSIGDESAYGSSSDIDISFPRIVVVGSQSAGKSSVLEALVRRDFLPRSNGICTRRPLELRLHNISSSLSKKQSIDNEENQGNEKNVDSASSSTEKKRHKKDECEEYAVFGHLPDKKIYDFELVKEEIIKQTTEIAGSDRGISQVPIILEIFSPKVVPLSLVDLPGVTKVPVGNQPFDIERLTEELTLKYIKEEDTIILAVTAANVDIANSDAIKLAKKVDPKGLRTVGVLTKLDLMDKGTDAKDILTGRGDIVLRHGFIGVVCRSQADSNKTIDDAIEKENEFLSSHYGSMARVNGSLYLGRRLSELLIASIKKELPNIREKIRRQLQSVNEQLKQLGDPVGADHSTKSRILLTLLASYAEMFTLSIDGNSSESNNGNYLNEVSGGARISYCFSESFEKQILKLSPLEGLDDAMIRTVISGSSGLETSLSVPERAFRKLVHSQIKQLKFPCIQLVDMINDELQRVAIQSETPELKRFRILNEKVNDVVRAFLDGKAEETRQMVSNIINIELAHINTRHPSFNKDVLFHPLESRRRGSFSHIQKSSSFQLAGIDISHDKNPRSRLQNGLPSPPLISSDSAHSIMSEPIHLQSRNDSDISTSAIESTADEAATNKANSGVGSFFFNIYQSSKSNGSKSASSTPTPFKLAPIPFANEINESSADDEVDRGVNIVKSLLESYMSIVHTTLMDIIPKTIICFLVNASKSEVHHELMTSLYKEGLIDKLLEEDEDIAIERRRLTRIREALTEASALLMDIKELKSSLPLA